MIGDGNTSHANDEELSLKHCRGYHHKYIHIPHHSPPLVHTKYLPPPAREFYPGSSTRVRGTTRANLELAPRLNVKDVGSVGARLCQVLGKG